jgi:hypothetical protein
VGVFFWGIIMTVRAKFTVAEIHRFHTYPQAARVVMQPIYDTSIPEDQRFCEATPTGSLEMVVNNPAAIEQLQLGASFYLDFTPVPETAAT